MTIEQTPSFGPSALTQLYSAFDNAWAAVENQTNEHNRDGARDAVGKAIIDLAKVGYGNPTHLANYGAHQGRQFIDLKG